MDQSPIGLIGVGLLGTALAERMLSAGLDVLGYDRDAAACVRLTGLGGRPAASSDEIAASCEKIVLCLPDSRVVAEVIESFGDHLSRGKLIVDATTGDPEATVTLAAQLARQGVGYIDATIAGSSEQARRGEAVVIIGGESTGLERASSVLAAWSERRFHVGPAGSGARMKLVVNLVLGLNRAVLAEGLSLAQACGIAPDAALQVLRATPAYSAAMETKGPKMVAADYTPQARLAQHLKDVRLIRELARRHSAHAPLSETHERLLEAAAALGFSEADNSAIIEAFRSQ
jgi:3-hydroxyisobutyrate dehydrogenase-like beta-hydroxyacid dehydrogenase